jgi:DNA polymerase-3 subunit gamma/tau
MSYTALYRKFRPDNFEDVKGQEHIVKTLRNQIKADRIGHAYLFCGTRGTGKTTVAKLLAKAVNCEHLVDGNPCNECRMCKAIAAQASMNVIEIDAASNNGVENVREIVEEVKYSPTEGKYKVYIIDEVHMLSTGAFNALLKTIEEPPPYVIFILATTEVHKIPITILSRCQRYDFKQISIDTITDRLKELMQIEHIEAEEKALRYVARAGDGSMRDALSLLDQCISFYLGSKLTYDNVLGVLGAVDTQVFAELLQNIGKQDVAGCIKLLEEIETSGRELGQFTIDFIWYLRNLLLLKTSQDVSDIIIEVSTENMALLRQEAEKIEEQTLIRYICVLSELSNQIRYASRKRILIEIALIKLCRPQMEENYDALVDRIRILEEKLKKGVVINTGKQSLSMDELKAEKVEKPVILPEALPEDIKDTVKKWRTIVSWVTKKAPPLGSALQNVTVSMDGEHGILLVVTDELDKKVIDGEVHMQLIKDTIADMVKKQVNIKTKYLNKREESGNDIVNLEKILKIPIQYE